MPFLRRKASPALTFPLTVVEEGSSRPRALAGQYYPWSTVPSGGYGQVIYLGRQGLFVE